MERLKRVINWACKMDWLPKNPFDQPGSRPAIEIDCRSCPHQKTTNLPSRRHTLATLQLMNGVPIETIKKLLGHTKITTTMIYAHVVNAKVGMDMEAFERRIELKKGN